MKLFEYAVLLHPEKDKEQKDIGKTEVLRPVSTILAKDEKQVGMIAAREIPNEHMDHLERVEIIVRPF